MTRKDLLFIIFLSSLILFDVFLTYIVVSIVGWTVELNLIIRSWGDLGLVLSLFGRLILLFYVYVLFSRRPETRYLTYFIMSIVHSVIVGVNYVVFAWVMMVV